MMSMCRWKDSEKDHATIIEVLAAFIRTPSSDQRQRNLALDGPSDEEGDTDATVPLAVDVSAALTVVGRRPDPDATPIADLRRIDWSNTDLEHANLQHVDLTGADLRGSDLTGAHLRGADFQGAHLTGAGLREVDLRGVTLRGVDLTGVDITGLRLGRVDLTGAQQ